MSFKSGFVAVVGQPNVGKSTLVNALVGQKVSIVSPKSQTTRTNVLGVLNNKDYQIIFIDTPGIHNSKNNLDKYMQKNIDSATKDIDLMLYVLDGSKDFDAKDLERLTKYCQNNYKVIAVVNKIDLTGPQSIYPRLEALNKIPNLFAVYGVSGLKHKNLEALIDGIVPHLSDTIKYYPDDMYVDKPTSFVLSEIIREKMLWLLNDEIPHGVAIVITKLDTSSKTTHIDATIYCEKQAHKSIIIGKNGSMLKKLGTASREAMQKFLESPVFLELFVKVEPNWRNKIDSMQSLGYDNQDF
ncbi:MAG: GTPase Era [Clostridia bacterium]|nr:GTPase Era [Clostridia bacterium]